MGAGMDTRAWRLKLAEGVRWYEVDQERVLRAKLTTLKQQGAQVSHSSGDHNTRHYLQCASYNAVRAYLCLLARLTFICSASASSACLQAFSLHCGLLCLAHEIAA